MSSIRLHLGCGQRYLEGYRNIDFPLDEHTVQSKSVADEHSDLLNLSFNRHSIAEVRSHHVFEHFTRPVALALMCSWNTWLQPGGTLRIEVPDFTRTALNIINPFTSNRERCVGIRHLFGSNEATWAVHYEGWTEKTFVKAASATGFQISEIRKNRHLGTFNKEYFARKVADLPTGPALDQRIADYLRLFTLDDTSGELKLLEVWMKDFGAQLERSRGA